jgi:uncharacterized membrane protein YdjX (TVP38/TMEM64 family)
MTRLDLVWRTLLLISAVAVLVGAYWLLAEQDALTLLTDGERLRTLIQGLGPWGPAAIIGAMALAIVLNPIPSAPIALAAGAAYGHTWGTLYVVLGAELGAVTAFALARLLGQDLLLRVLGERASLGWLGSQNALTGLVFVSRLLPFVSFDLISYGAGLTPIKPWRFALATFAGILPASFLLAHFGGELAGDNLNRAALALLAVGLLFLFPLLWRAVRAGRAHLEKGSP